MNIIQIIELSTKSLEEGWNYGFDPSLRKLSFKSSLACHVLEHVWKMGEKFGNSYFQLSNFEKNVGFKIWYEHGVVLNFKLAYVRLAWPTHPSAINQKPIFNSPTPLLCMIIHVARRLQVFFLTGLIIVSILINSECGSKYIVSYALLSK